MPKDYYKVLELESDASSTDVKKAYHRLSRIWHPDKNPDNVIEAKKRFQDISEAYQVLINESTRRQYDRSCSMGDGNFSFDMSPEFFKAADDLFREFFGGLLLDEALEEFLNDPLFRDLTSTLAQSVTRRTDAQNFSSSHTTRQRRTRQTAEDGDEQREFSDDMASEGDETEGTQELEDIVWQIIWLILTPLLTAVKEGIVAKISNILQPFNPIIQPIYFIFQAFTWIFWCMVSGLQQLRNPMMWIGNAAKLASDKIQSGGVFVSVTQGFGSLFQNMGQLIVLPLVWFDEASKFVPTIVQPFILMFSSIGEAFASIYEALKQLLLLPVMLRPAFEMLRALANLVYGCTRRLQVFFRR